MRQSDYYTAPAGSDRRASERFPIAEEIHYHILDRRLGDHDGAGTTVDMSRGGVLFTTNPPLARGRLVEVSVNWPAMLDGVCPLKFVALGHVVRSSGSHAVVRIERYQFKTRGRTLAKSA